MRLYFPASSLHRSQDSSICTQHSNVKFRVAFLCQEFPYLGTRRQLVAITPVMKVSNSVLQCFPIGVKCASTNAFPFAVHDQEKLNSMSKFFL